MAVFNIPLPNQQKLILESSSLKPITGNLPSSQLQIELWINKDGGVLEIPDTGVSLEIPPGALEKDQLIQMRIMPYNFQGKQPVWRPQPDTSHVLTERHCVINLKSFSWKKFKVDDKTVKGKRIVLYAAIDLSSSESVTHIHVGYYWDKPGYEKIVSINKVSVLVKQPSVFLKKGQLPLECHFVKLDPPAWNCGSKGGNLKEIPFDTVAITMGQFRTFVLNIKEGTQERPACTCHFEAGQESKLVELLFILKDGGKDSVENIDLEVRTESLRDLSEKIPKEWKTVGIKLGLDDSELCHHEIDYTNQGHKETVYRSLLTWKQRNGSQATYIVLGEALIAAGRRDLQEKLY